MKPEKEKEYLVKLKVEKGTAGENSKFVVRNAIDLGLKKWGLFLKKIEVKERK